MATLEWCWKIIVGVNTIQKYPVLWFAHFPISNGIWSNLQTTFHCKMEGDHETSPVPNNSRYEKNLRPNPEMNFDLSNKKILLYQIALLVFALDMQISL